MEKIVIRGGHPLSGTVEVSGMKNAAVGVLLSTILIDGVTVLENLPVISDVALSLDILRSMGAIVEQLDATTYQIDTRHVRAGSAPPLMVRKMRASYYVIGAELGRFHTSRVGIPGGCDFGVRPIDQHIKCFEALGADVEVTKDFVIADAKSGLHGDQIYFDSVSVGATINGMIAATLADGTTVIENAAREPHVVDVANFLNTCGARITGAGTDVVKIKGVKRLHGCTYAIIPDMIEAATYMIAAAATNGTLQITNVIPKHLESVSAKMEEMGVKIEELDDAVIVSPADQLRRVNVKTLPYPGFPTDAHPQMSVLLCLAQGVSHVSEGVWDNRFRYVEELRRMGADITVEGKVATINGGNHFTGAKVRAVDLRAGAAMIIAALAAQGKTEIDDIYHIKRGYDNIVGKLQNAGADIQLVDVPDE